MKNDTYDVALSNKDCIFDSRHGFESIAEAMEWAMGRGGNYVIQISRENADAPGCCISAECNADSTETRLYWYNGWEWEQIDVEDIKNII